VRDNDRAYGQVFTDWLAAMGIRDRPISPGSFWQNGVAERLIGTLSPECLHVVVVGEHKQLARGAGVAINGLTNLDVTSSSSHLN
jgi:hypothetical protein